MFVTVIAFCLASVSADAGIRIGSWNLKHLGWNNGKDLDAVAHIIGRFDLVALQEVMDPAAARKLAHIVAEQTGEPWGVTTSQLEGDSSYKESYAYLWRKSAVAHDGGDSLYVDPGNKFAREPFTAEFTAEDSHTELTLGTVHISYGDNRSDRTAEIKVLDQYWRWMGTTYHGRRLLMGDFNMPPTDPAWRGLDSLATPSITSGASTLSKTQGRYAHLYDNIWHNKSDRLNITARGVLHYPAILGMSHKIAYAKVSDHAPVYIVLGHGKVDTAPAKGQKTVQTTPSAATCIDINTASPSQLERLDHVGPATAKRIATHRPYRSLGGLTKVSGLSRGYVADIRRGELTCSIN
ncbi:helix-hairpin-helix domain-containing protein [Salinisphaera sp. RV14]|uniref:helix-hairpin-helix domain-containing protein n=1 Tax=Salinisphaera sp. RV14 TaxID=3454140 RepID=UPI003F83B62B